MIEKVGIGSHLVRSGTTRLIPAILMAGLLISLFRVRESVPFYPMDLVSYVGGYYANRDGGDAYDKDDSRSSLAARGVTAEPYSFVYPPPFLITMLPLEVVPYRFFRLAWVGAAALCGWFAVFLLSRRLRKPWDMMFTVGALLFLTVSQALHDNLVCGQVTSFMVLALAAVLHAGFGGFRAGLASAVFPVMKLYFLPLSLFIKGKRAVVSCLVALALLSVVAALVFGAGTFPAWGKGIEYIGKVWGLGIPSNLGITNALDVLAETAISPMDRARAAIDHGYRQRVAGNARAISKAMAASLAALAAAFAGYALFRERRSKVPPRRERVLSATVLYLLVFMPCVWIHYGTFLLFPFRDLCLRGRLRAAWGFLASALVWGMPLGTFPGWPRFLIPLCWLFWFAFRGEMAVKDGAPPGSIPHGARNP